MNDTNPPQRVCPQCRKQVDFTTRFCNYCAFELPPLSKAVEERFETIAPAPQSTSIRSFLIFLAVIALVALAIYVVNTREGAKKTNADVVISPPAFPATNNTSNVAGYQAPSNSGSIPSDPPMPPTAGTRRGELTTDSNLRSEPEKNDYNSVGIHFTGAKFEILDETSYEVDGQISNWYKVRIFEYGCSKDDPNRCGKNTEYDADEGWVNGKNLQGDGIEKVSSNTVDQPLKESRRSTYRIRVYDVDDIAIVYLNGSAILRVPYSRTDEIDISNQLRPGSNEVRLVIENTVHGYSYGFEILKDKKPFFKDNCGRVQQGESAWCGNKTAKTGIVYDRKITIPVN